MECDMHNQCACPEAERLLQEAKAQAQQILAEAQEQKNQAQALLESAQATIAAQQRIFGTEFNAYMAWQRDQWAAEQPLVLQARTELAQQTATLKEQACGFSNDVSATLTGVMEQLLEMKASFTTQLQQWKTELYDCEYSPIVGCFNSLLTLQQRFERDVAAEATMTEQDRLTKLQQHSTSLTGFRNRLERAMNTMGLFLFTPQSGDSFDACCHTLDSDEDDEQYDGRLIDRCTGPGILRQVNSQERVILQRAVVTVKEKDQLTEDRQENQLE